MKKITYCLLVVLLSLVQTDFAFGQKKTPKKRPTKSAQQTTVQLTGDFDSAKGRMHPLSVLGYNIGYLNGTKSGSNTQQRFVVCFDRLAGGQDMDINGHITVEGYFEVKKREANPNPQLARPVGSESSTDTIFYVTQWRK